MFAKKKKKKKKIGVGKTQVPVVSRVMDFSEE